MQTRFTKCMSAEQHKYPEDPVAAYLRSSRNSNSEKGRIERLESRCEFFARGADGRKAEQK